MVKASQTPNGGFGRIEIMESGLSLDKGRIYYATEGMSKAIRIVNDLTLDNHDVLVITRYHPSILREMIPNYVRTHWLSERMGEMNLNPGRPDGIIDVIESFLDSSRDPVICLDGIEYLSVHMERRGLLRMVEEMNDLIMESGAIMLVPINPRSFDSRTLASVWRYAEIL